MAFPVSVVLNWPKIMEMDKKYNKKMQLSSYILAGWLLNGSTGLIQEKALLKTKNHRIAEIRKPTEEDLARSDLLDLAAALQCATSRGAALFGLQEGAGRLAPGSPATFLAVRAKPVGLLDGLPFPERICIEEIAVKP